MDNAGIGPCFPMQSNDGARVKGSYALKLFVFIRGVKGKYISTMHIPFLAFHLHAAAL